MPADVYQKLARHLDDLPGGFPSTESGVELRILRRLFTPEEAELALKCSLIPEEAKVIARRAGLDAETGAQRLEELASKGLIFRLALPGGPRYMAAQYVIGIWEYHVNDLDPELIKDMNDYIPHLFTPETWKKAPQLRTIPVGRSLTPDNQVLPFEQAEALVKSQKRALVAPCICRREHTMTGKGCDKPEESCLVFGMGVDYYLRNGLGREISIDEALAILARADEAGLVLQPSNAQKVVNICCCCGCCCQVLKTLKRHPQPASLVSSAFIAQADPDECQGCEVCVERCQMDALSMVDGLVSLNQDRCIGCGLCVTTCPSGALTLQRKPEEQQSQVPRNMYESMVQLGRARGKLSPTSMAMMGIKSKVDRLRAAK